MLRDDEISSRVREELRLALGTGDIAEEREDALDRYHAEKVGVLADPGEGRSSVVIPVVQETVEAALPALITPFLQHQQALRFDPVGEEDIDGSEQETAAINHVFYKLNDGYNVIQTAVKDGLISKNGYGKFWWEIPSPVITTWHDINDITLAEIDDSPDVEILERSEEDELGFMSIRVKVKRSGYAAIDVVAPENLKVSNDARNHNLQLPRFVAEHSQRSISDLIIDWPEFKEELEMLGGGAMDDEDHGGMQTRHNQSDEDPNITAADRAMRLVEYVEAYYRIDADEDGVAERRVIIMADKLVLLNEEISHVPYVSWTPIIEPHKHIGRGFGDGVGTWQDVDSTIFRQILDNAYLANNPEKEVVEDWLAPDGLDDLMVSRAGGIKRVRQPGAIREIPTSFTAGQMFPLLEYTESKKQDVTGVRSDMANMDKNVLANANTGVVRDAKDALNERIGIYAQNFAEQFMKPIMLGIHKLLLEHQNEFEEIAIPLRGSFVPVHPMEWIERSNMTAVPGLGAGSREKQVAGLGAVIEAQAALQERGLPIVSPQKQFNAISDWSRLMGVPHGADRYFIDPRSQEGQQMAQQSSQPSMEQQLLMLQQKVEQARLQLDGQKAQQEFALKQADLELSQQRNLLAQQKNADETVDRRTDMELQYETNVPGAGV